MLPSIPYNGALRPVLMLIGMAAPFMILQRMRVRPNYVRLLQASVGIYLLFLLYATLLSRTVGDEYSYRLEPLVTLRQAFAVEDGVKLKNPQALEGIVVNLLLTLPIGYLLPQMLPLSAVRAVLLGAGVSLCIELIQLITRLGMFELDDFIYNTLGAALGYWLLVCMEKHTGAQLRR